MTVFQKLFWLTQMGIDCICKNQKRQFLIPEKNQPQSISPSLQSRQSALSKTATHTLLGTGIKPAVVLCVLNAPSAEEDKTGLALSGSEGEMTKKMLASIGLNLEKNTYLTYLSPWRPPGNRLLTNVEIREGKELLQKCIQQVQPTYLLLLGSETVRALMDGKTLSMIRSGHYTYAQYPVYATFSAAALIKNPQHRRQAWEDLKKIQTHLDNL